MPDAYDTLITRAFEQLRAGAVSTVRAPGTRQFATRAARRRRWLAGICAAGALVLAVPAAAVVSGQGLRPNPEPAPTGDAKVFPAQLAEAHAAVPPDPKWGKCSPTIGFKPPTHTPYAVYAQDVVYTNLDNDPAVETAAFVRCMLPDGKFVSQIVAYDRNAAGEPVSLGTIIPPQTPHDVVGMQLRDTGDGVSVRVVWQSGPLPVSDPVGQVRDFVWDGRTFAQMAGQTSFIRPENTDILVTSDGPLTLTRNAQGNYDGVLRIQVLNNGPSPTQELKIVLQYGPGASEKIGLAEFGGWLGNTSNPLRPGESTTIQMNLGTDGFADILAVGVYSHVIDTDLRNNYAVVGIIRKS